jgi:outer membrane lipoprotein-sorting protein
MKQKYLLMGISVLIMLGLIGGIIFLPKLTQTDKQNSLSSVDEALTLTLNSHLKWSTIQGEAVITMYGSEGQKQENTETFQIEQPNKALLSLYETDMTTPVQEWISDGSNIYIVENSTRTYSSSPLPKFSKDFSLLPETLEAARSTDAVYRHPFGMLIQYPVGEYLYPQWMAQGKGAYTFVGVDTLLDRPVLVINIQNGNGDVTVWIDQGTGIILKYAQKTEEKPFMDMVFTKFTLDAPLDNSLFSIPVGFTQR